MNRQADLGVRDVHLLPIRHPPESLFERIYDAVLASGQGADLEDLRARLRRFRASIDREGLPIESTRERWRAFADGLAGAIDELEAGRPDLARAALDAGLRAYMVGRFAG